MFFFEIATNNQFFLLKVGILWRSGEGNDIADVLHTRHEEDQALEAESEAGMRTCAPAAGVEIPPEMGLVHLPLVDLCHEFVVVLLTDGASDDLADLGEEDIGALHGGAGGDASFIACGGTAAVNRTVLLHVEGLDGGGIVGHDDGLLEMLLHEIALML